MGKNGWDHHVFDGKPKAIDKSHIECFQCHTYGHYHSECYTNLNRGMREVVVEFVAEKG